MSLQKFKRWNFFLEGGARIQRRDENYTTQLNVQQCNVYTAMSMRFSVVHMAWGALPKRLQRKTTRSHFFYYDKCGNGKMYPFANVFFFAIWGGKLFYRLLTYKLQVFIFASSNGKKLQMEIFCHFNFCHNRRNTLS